MMHKSDFKKLREENEYLRRKLEKAIHALSKMYTENRELLTYVKKGEKYERKTKRGKKKTE